MKPETITFSLDEDELRYIGEMATDMFNCQIRRRNRTYEQVYASTKAGKILEFALVRQGAQHNPLEFDVKNRESYAYDVVWNSLRTEVKRKRFLSNDTTKYYSWNKPEYVKTFLKNTDIVEQLIVGDYIELSDNLYKVEWMLVTRIGNNFKSYLKKSLYNSGQMYYNHNMDNNCQYLLGGQ